MKIYILLIFTALFTILFEKPILAQNKCKGYHLSKCQSNSQFHYSGYSKSAEFYRGTTSRFKILALANLDYHFVLCYKKEAGNVQFKIMEDNEAKTLLYDNFTDNFSQDIVITTVFAKPLIVEVTLSGDASQIKHNSEKFCIGLLIEYRKTPQKG